MATQVEQKSTGVRPSGGADAVYGIGVIGAWIYYFRRATTTKERIGAFFKGLVWPAFLVYALLDYLQDE